MIGLSHQCDWARGAHRPSTNWPESRVECLLPSCPLYRMPLCHSIVLSLLIKARVPNSMTDWSLHNNQPGASATQITVSMFLRHILGCLHSVCTPICVFTCSCCVLQCCATFTLFQYMPNTQIQRAAGNHVALDVAESDCHPQNKINIDIRLMQCQAHKCAVCGVLFLEQGYLPLYTGTVVSIGEVRGVLKRNLGNPSPLPPSLGSHTPLTPAVLKTAKKCATKTRRNELKKS